MNKYLVPGFALAASLAWMVGCSGSAEEPCSCPEGCSGQGGGAGAAGNPGGAGGSAGGVVPNSIAGAWEFTGTRYGSGEMVGVLSLSADHFFLQTAGGGVSAALQHDGLFAVLVTDDTEKSPWEYQYDLPVSSSFTIERTVVGGPFNPGAFPMDLSGSWLLEDREGPTGPSGCGMNLYADAFYAGCNASKRFKWMPDFTHGQLECKRKTVLTSMFGDFGGEWQCTTTPANAACTFRFEGSTLSSNCSNAPGLDGTMTISFNGDLASGQTSTGFEFSAKRN